MSVTVAPRDDQVFKSLEGGSAVQEDVIGVEQGLPVAAGDGVLNRRLTVL